MINNFFFENRVVCEVMWKNIVEQGTSQMTIWRMRIAYWIPKSTNTRSELWNTYCISTTTKAARTRRNVTLYVHCLSCYVPLNTVLNTLVLILERKFR